MLSGYILVTINQLNSRDKIENARNETHILCSEFIFLSASIPRVSRDSSPRISRNLSHTGCVQNAHRCASIGMSLWHSGHFFLSGSACFSKRFIR